MNGARIRDGERHTSQRAVWIVDHQVAASGARTGVGGQQLQRSSACIPLFVSQVHCIAQQVAGAADHLRPPQVWVDRQQTHAMRIQFAQLARIRISPEVVSGPEVKEVQPARR